MRRTFAWPEENGAASESGTRFGVGVLVVVGDRLSRWLAAHSGKARARARMADAKQRRVPEFTERWSRRLACHRALAGSRGVELKPTTLSYQTRLFSKAPWGFAPHRRGGEAARSGTILIERRKRV